MIVLILGLILLFFLFMRIHAQHKKPLRTAVINMIAGVGSLVVIAPIAGLAVNVYTVFASLALGVPGTLLVTFGKIVL